MGLTDVQLGVVGASFMWVYAAAAPLAGMAGDRFARKTIVVGGLIFWSLVTVATALSTQLLAPGASAARSKGSAKHFTFRRRCRCSATITGRRHALARDVDPPVERLRRHDRRRNRGRDDGRGARLAIELLSVRLARRGARAGARSSLLREPARGEPVAAPAAPVAARRRGILRTPMVLILMAVFVGANFVAAIVLTWMPSFLVAQVRHEPRRRRLQQHRVSADRLGARRDQRRRAGRSPGAAAARRADDRAGDRPARRRAVHLRDRLDAVGAGADPRDGRLRLLQGAVRREHLGVAARRRPARSGARPRSG